MWIKNCWTQQHEFTPYTFNRLIIVQTKETPAQDGIFEDGPICELWLEKEESTSHVVFDCEVSLRTRVWEKNSNPYRTL